MDEKTPEIPENLTLDDAFEAMKRPQTVEIGVDFLNKLKNDNQLMASVLKVYANEKNWKKTWSIGDGKYVYSFRYAGGHIPACEVLERVAAGTHESLDTFGEDALD